MDSCNSHRVFIFLTFLFIATTAILTAILIWRELRDKKEKLDETTVTAVYPGLFKTATEKQALFDRYMQSFYFNRTSVDSTFVTEQTCRFDCYSKLPQRKKRVVGSAVLNHGCCQSSILIDAPSTMTNSRGTERTILQFPRLKQFFIVHHCSHMIGCTGCTCSQEEQLYSAVVHRVGVADPDEVEETEVDFFFVNGCCKCVNT